MKDEGQIILGAIRFLLQHHAKTIAGYDPNNAKEALDHDAAIAEIEERDAKRLTPPIPIAPATGEPAPAA